MRDQFSMSFEGPIKEDLVNRGDRSQVATDIGRTVQTLINSAII